MSYKVTIFNENGGVVLQRMCEEYPDDIQCTQNQWIDICRVDLTEDDMVSHDMVSHDMVSHDMDDDLLFNTYLNGELEEDEYGRPRY